MKDGILPSEHLQETPAAPARERLSDLGKKLPFPATKSAPLDLFRREVLEVLVDEDVIEATAEVRDRGMLSTHLAAFEDLETVDFVEIVIFGEIPEDRDDRCLVATSRRRARETAPAIFAATMSDPPKRPGC